MGRGLAPWIRSARADTALALAWIPFAAAAFALRNDATQLGQLVEVLAAFSFLHQPLTLPLVYGDRDQFAARRVVFVVGPLALAAVIALGLTVSFTLVAVIGGLWNMEHTLMQRYGFARIYGRRAGEHDGRLERTMLLSWLVVTLLSVAADTRTPGRIEALPLGRLNSGALDVLASWRPYALVLLVPTAAVAATCTVRWLVVERTRIRQGTANRPKLLYLGSTGLMFAIAILVDPVAGFAGYAGAHAVEYFFIVDHRLASSRSPGSRRRFFAAYFAVVIGVYVLARSNDQWLLWAVLYFGGLHFLFDGFIWKGRSKPTPSPQPIAANVSA